MINVCSKKYESLDYDTNYNSILVDELRHKGYKFVFKQVRTNPLMTFFIICLQNLVYWNL